MTDITFNTDIRRLPGIGEKRAAMFARLGITDTGTLLYHFPRGYQHRGDIRLLSEASDGEVCAFILTISSNPITAMLQKHMTVTKLTAFDDSGKCNITFFNQNFIKNVFTVGSVFRFWGKITVKGMFRDLTSPQYEPVIDGIPLPEFKALYPLTDGITQNIIATLISNILSHMNGGIPEIIPSAIREKHGLCTASYAFRAIHCPISYDTLNRGRDYFIFEELYIFALAIHTSKKALRQSAAPKMTISEQQYHKFLSSIPFSLTAAQKRSVDEIFHDLAAGIPMNRMLSGDVGSGKTICAAAAIFCAALNDFQSVLMAPTEILAGQHYNDLCPLFDHFGIKTALLTGSVKTAEKRVIYENLLSGAIKFVIGTHAVISSGVQFSCLGLVITDEQHRFGVAQRAALSEKGGSINPHILVMSATPIPRSLALVLYGDLDLSVLDELPPGRQIIDTFIVSESYRTRLDAFIRRHTDAGNQVYVVCPSVEAKEEDPDGGEVVKFGYKYDAEEIANASLPLKNAVETAERLQITFPDLSVGYVHGRLKASEKDRVMRDFNLNLIQILVSTTVIEVGVNVPNATLMIVENAERFGLSQLHQLRGRVGRGRAKSFCVLVTDSRNEQSLARLAVMRETNNGYKIAERDLELRGPGDFFPQLNGDIRQHGGFRFRLASLCSNMETLKDAFYAAASVLKDDPDLCSPENKPSSDAVTSMFGLDGNSMN
ncbi:MAG: ATP-dependent DNA helicase RecG [Eubacteriales bacterium]